MKASHSFSAESIKIILSTIVIAVLATMAATAQDMREYIAPRASVPEVPQGYTGVGPVVSGSVDYSSIPSKARKFLQKHCDGHAVVKCEKQYQKNLPGS